LEINKKEKKMERLLIVVSGHIKGVPGNSLFWGERGELGTRNVGSPKT